MFDRITHHLRLASMRRRVEQAVRTGTGLHRRSWLLDPGTPQERTAQITRIAADISEWCRERTAESRRPYGVDQMALAVACAAPGGKVIASRTFGIFRPLDLYRPDGIDQEIAAFIRSIPTNGVDAPNLAKEPLRFAAALLSWGDLTDQLMPNAAADPPAP